MADLRPLATVLLFLALLVSACSGPAKPEIPENAIPMGEDLYMVPLDRPLDGCPAFRAFSPTRMVLQAIFFRTKAEFREEEGTFTLDRNKADCG